MIVKIRLTGSVAKAARTIEQALILVAIFIPSVIAMITGVAMTIIGAMIAVEDKSPLIGALTFWGGILLCVVALKFAKAEFLSIVGENGREKQ